MRWAKLYIFIMNSTIECLLTVCGANSIEESHQWLVIDIQFKNRIMSGRGGEDKLEVDEIIMMSQPCQLITMWVALDRICELCDWPPGGTRRSWNDQEI